MCGALADPVCRVQTTAADWIGANLQGGAVVKEKFVGGSNWSSAYVYTTQGWLTFVFLVGYLLPWPHNLQPKIMPKLGAVGQLQACALTRPILK